MPGDFPFSFGVSVDSTLPRALAQCDRGHRSRQDEVFGQPRVDSLLGAGTCPGSTAPSLPAPRKRHPARRNAPSKAPVWREVRERIGWLVTYVEVLRSYMQAPSPDKLRSELERVQGEARANKLFHAMQASLVRRARYTYGLIAAALAAAAGTTALFDAAPGLVAALAFASPVVASLQRLARPESRAGQHHELRAGYESLEHRTRVFIATEFDSNDPATGRAQLNKFLAESDELLRNTPGDLAVLGADRGLFRLAWRAVRGKALVQPSDEPKIEV